MKNNRIQHYIAQNIAHELSTQLHSKVKFGEVDYKIFNAISINNLYIEDLHKDTLLFTKTLDAHFDLWKILNGTIEITSLDFEELTCHLKVEKNGLTNLDFILKALKKPKTDKPSQVSYHIKDFKLSNSSFSFTNLKSYQSKPSNQLNFTKLQFNSINADIALDVLDKDTMSLRIKNFSAVEKSGFKLTKFRTSIFGSHTSISIPNLELEMPNSYLQMNEINLKYDSLADFNHFADKVKFKFPINASYIALSDLKSVVPSFKTVQGLVGIKGVISGRVSSLHLKKLELKYGNSFLITDLDINGLPRLDDAFIFGKINQLNVEKVDLQDFIADLTNKPFVLPPAVDQMGKLNYRGNISGFLNNLVLYGNLQTKVGSISTDILLKFENSFKDFSYNGTVKSSNFQLGKLLLDKQFGKITFSINTQGQKTEKTNIQGLVNATISDFMFKNYIYHDIQFGGKYDGKGFDGKVAVKDANVNAQFIGKIDLTKELPIFNFNLNVLNSNLNALKLTNSYPGATLSFNGITNLVGNSLDNVNGSIRFNNIVFVNQNKTLMVSNIDLLSRIEAGLTQFVISSDYINGSFKGDFKYSSIGQTIKSIIRNYLPILALDNEAQKSTYPNQIKIDLKLSNTQKLSEVLALPYELKGVSTINGSIDEELKKIELNADFPSLMLGNRQIENVSVHCNNSNKILNLSSRGQLMNNDGLTNLYLSSIASLDSVNTKLVWHNSNKITNAGEIQANTKLKKENGRLTAKVSLLPSQVIISDSIWNIHPCAIHLSADSTIHVGNFLFENEKKEFVQVDGIISERKQDSLNVKMSNLNLEFVMILLKLKGITFSGNATGSATLFSVLKQPVFEAKLVVSDFQINHKILGDFHLTSNWDKSSSQLQAIGECVNKKNDTIVVAKAIYTPKTDSINVFYNTRNFSLEFLTPYLGSVVDNFKAYASGKIKMYGTLKTGITFAGDAFISNAQATVKAIKVAYTFNDSIHLTSKKVEFRNIKIYDPEHNVGTLMASLSHGGCFQNLKFDAILSSKNIMGLNTHAKDNEYFYGKAFANGSVRIFGDDTEATINVNASTQPKTKCFVQMGGASTASDNGFIVYEKKKKKSITSKKDPLLKIAPKNSFNVKVNLLMDVNTNAELELIVDPKGGDQISAKGAGEIRLEFDSHTPMKLYGAYTVNNGLYRLTIGNAIRKDFKIDHGGVISWTGEPLNAQVNLRALYPLTASLKDLMDETQLQSMGRTSIPVNCVLKLSDNLTKPTINFEIELPTSDEGVRQQVRSIINTDEMMNRQILSLLALNKFYTPEYMRTATTNVAANDGMSFLTSTVSAQFNNMLSKALNNNDISFGLDVRKTDELSSVYQTNILYQPNNRLLVNGNVGYRNDNLSDNKYITDIDAEYRLTDAGKLRLKAYNHTIDRNMLRAAKQTQGLGFLYKEDFDGVGDMLSHYWRVFTLPKKRKGNETVPSDNK